MSKINERDIIASSDGSKTVRELDRRNAIRLAAARMVKEKRAHKQYA